MRLMCHMTVVGLGLESDESVKKEGAIFRASPSFFSRAADFLLLPFAVGIVIPSSLIPPSTQVEGVAVAI